MRELEMIKMQEQHIANLQAKIDEMKKNVSSKFMSKDSCITFFTKRCKSYNRPKSLAALQYYRSEGQLLMSFDFDKDNSKNMYITLYAGWSMTPSNKCGKTCSFPITELQEFLSDVNEEDAKSYASSQEIWFTRPYNAHPNSY